MKEKLVLTAGK